MNERPDVHEGVEYLDLEALRRHVQSEQRPAFHIANSIPTLRAWAKRNPELAALGVLLLLGALLRTYLTIQWRPAITGYSDSGIYIQDAASGLFVDPLRVVGYGIFLNALHWLTPHLLLVTIVQHVMGLATAVLFFAAVRRCGGPLALGLVPAAVISLGGTELLLEHAALSETLFTFLIALALYGAMRVWTDSFQWGALAGAAIALAVTVRGAGTLLLPLVLIWLLFCRGRPTRDTALAALLALGMCVAVFGGYIGWRHHDTGLSGLTTNSNWFLYGRVAPFADCTKFTPPAGTGALCDPVPPGRRVGRFPEAGPAPGPGDHENSQNYIFFSSSPAQQLLGPPYLVSNYPHAMTLLHKWSVAVIEHQPLDYLDAVWNDSVRVVFPDHHSLSGLSADETVGFLLGGPDLRSGRNDFVSYWQGRYYPHEEQHHGDMNWFLDYESFTRVEGLWMLLALGFAAVASFMVPRSARAGTILLVLTAFALLWFPIFTTGYDFRYVIPALGPLFAAAVLGAWGVWFRLRTRSRARQWSY